MLSKNKLNESGEDIDNTKTEDIALVKLKILTLVKQKTLILVKQKILILVKQKISILVKLKILILEKQKILTLVKQKILILVKQKILILKKNGNWKRRQIVWVFWNTGHVSELCEKWIYLNGKYAYTRFEQLRTHSGEVLFTREHKATTSKDKSNTYIDIHELKMFKDFRTIDKTTFKTKTKDKDKNKTTNKTKT